MEKFFGIYLLGMYLILVVHNTSSQGNGNCNMYNSTSSFQPCVNNANCLDNLECLLIPAINVKLCACHNSTIMSSVLKKQCYSDSDCDSDPRFQCESNILNQCLFVNGEACLYHVQCASLACHNTRRLCIRRV